MAKGQAMRKLGLGLFLAGFAGMAAAGDGTLDSQYADSNDYSAKLFYRMDFGGTAPGFQSVGLRFDNERAEQRGAPALFKASFSTGSMLPTLALQGVDVAGPVYGARADDGATVDDGRFATLSTGQWIGVIFTGAVLGTILFESADGGGEPSPNGTGGA